MKKKLNSRLLIILLIAISVVGCKKEETIPKTFDTILIDGEASDFNSAMIFGTFTNGEGYADVTFSANSKALVISFEYEGNSIVEGNYAFPQNDDKLYINNLKTFYTILESPEYTTKLDKGEIDIKDNGDNKYTVVLNLTMLDGKVFSGEYTGDFIVSFNNY